MEPMHERAIVIDGLIISKWDRSVFEDMHRGGLTAVNCTCSIWENFQETIDNIVEWKRWFVEHDDLLRQVRTTEDIERAKAEGRTGIILGFQNVSAFEDRIGYIEILKELGVGIAQIAYNTQNLIGSGCYESRDGGLSEFGHDAIGEMNRVGMMCDLSHVGDKTSKDVIRASSQPVCYSHCLPAGLKQHPRNKSDEQLRFIADHGGFVGVTMFPPFLARGPKSTIDDYVTAIDYVSNIVGEDAVGIGTDFTQGQPLSFYEWITHDKGDGRRLTDFGEIESLEGIGTIGEFPNLTAAMERAGWSEERVRKVIGGNWMRVLRDVWGA